MVFRRYFDAAFGRYAVTSALATGTDFALANAFHGLGVAPFSATFFGCVAGGVVAFWLGRGWTFRARNGHALPQLGRFCLVWVTSALLNSSGVLALLPAVASFPVAWLAVRGGVYLGWNYPLARWFVFRHRQVRRGSAQLDA